MSPAPMCSRFSAMRVLSAPLSGRTSADSGTPRRTIVSPSNSQLPKCAVTSSAPLPEATRAFSASQASVPSMPCSAQSGGSRSPEGNDSITTRDMLMYAPRAMSRRSASVFSGSACARLSITTRRRMRSVYARLPTKRASASRDAGDSQVRNAKTKRVTNFTTGPGGVPTMRRRCSEGFFVAFACGTDGSEMGAGEDTGALHPEVKITARTHSSSALPWLLAMGHYARHAQPAPTGGDCHRSPALRVRCPAEPSGRRARSDSSRFLFRRGPDRAHAASAQGRPSQWLCGGADAGPEGLRLPGHCGYRPRRGEAHLRRVAARKEPHREAGLADAGGQRHRRDAAEEREG